MTAQSEQAIQPMGFLEAIRYGVGQQIRQSRKLRAEDRLARRNGDRGFDWYGPPVQGEPTTSPELDHLAKIILEMGSRGREEPYDAEFLAMAEANANEAARFRASFVGRIYDATFVRRQEPIRLELPR